MTNQDYQKAQQFDDAWWAHQPPAVQALRRVEDTAARYATVRALEAQGYHIDEPIVVWNWSPFFKYTAAGLSTDPADYPPFYPPLPPPPPIPPGPAIAYDTSGPFTGFYQILNVPGINPSKIGMRVTVDGRQYELTTTGLATPAGPVLAWRVV